jgi:uncharacterized protein YydD (DUF2326 family)
MSLNLEPSSKLDQPSSRESRFDALQRATRRAVELKAAFQTAIHQAIALRDHLAHLQSALTPDRPAQRSDMQRLYLAVGVELPGVALRRFDEVEAFHDTVVANRRAHLEDEVARVTAQVEALERQANEADQARTAILRGLDGQS